jgi:2-polyprenyl-3-methyl-5-hydroxy-6-metoxy-1,4-benzoquinol methylase
MQWKQCLRCQHIFTDGYFTDETAKLIFNNVNEHQRVGYNIEQQRYVSARMVEKILPYFNRGNWLDIGFGNGSLLFTAQEYGFTPIGVDLREGNVTAMNSLGIRAYCSDLFKLSLDAPCSIISMADVLEHMPYPKDGLIAARKLLIDDGVLFISMPNCESMLWRAFDHAKSNPYWGELEHYHNFSRTRLYQLLEETGFEPIRYGISERYRACMEIVARKKS